MVYAGVPILKYEEGPDGSLFVYGRATDASVDLDDQIIDADFAKSAMEQWFGTFGNIRQMHSGGLPPAGVGADLEHREDGEWLRAEVYEPGAVLQVKKGGYKAFSVGIAQPRIVRDVRAKGGRVVGGKVVEVSLVDYPANPNCKFVVAEKQAFIGKAYQRDGDAWVELAKSGGAHSHFHIHGGGLAHVHPHTHTTGTPDHDGPHDGATHSHAHDDNSVPPDVAAKGTLSSKERGKLSGTDFGYTDSAGEGHFPLHNKSHVRAALGRFGQHDFETPKDRKQTAQRIVSRAKKHGIDVDPKSDVAQAAKGAKSAQKEASIARKNARRREKALSTFKRLHDLTCAAYSTDSLKAAYPAVAKNGLAAAVGPGARLAVFQMLQQELQEDNGTGAQASDIAGLGKAYHLLTDFLSTEGEPQTESLMALFAARDELHDAFLAVNKDILAVPGTQPPVPLSVPTGASGGVGGAPDRLADAGVGSGVLTDSPSVPSAESATGSVTPGQFRRPYLAAGHQREDGEGAGAPPVRPAGMNGGTSAGQYQRGLLTDGHQRQSPGDTKRAPVDLIAQLHDALLIAFPNIGCCMDLPTSYVDNGAANMPTPVERSLRAQLTKARKALAKAEAKAKTAAKVKVKATKPRVTKDKDRMCPNCGMEVDSDDQFCSSCGKELPTVGSDDADKASRARLTKGRACPGCGIAAGKGAKFCAKCGAGIPAIATPTKTKTRSAKAAARRAEKRAAKKFKSRESQLQKSIQTLESRLNKIAGQPDPAHSAFRREPLTTKSAEAETQKRKADENQERVTRLQKLAVDATDPQTRLRAQQSLIQIRKGAEPDLIKSLGYDAE